MPLSDSKKVASAINHMGVAMFNIRAQVDRINAIVTKFQAANPSVVDTPLQGNKATVLAAVTDLNTEVNKPVWDAVIAAVSPSHRGEAL